jgi:hypothetical protein
MHAMASDPLGPGGERPDSALDLLIKHERELFESDAERQGAADGRTAVTLTAALTLTGLSFSAWDDIAHATSPGEVGFAAVALIAAGLALLRTSSGYFHSRKAWFSTRSNATNAAIQDLRSRERELIPVLAPRKSEEADRQAPQRSGPDEEGLEVRLSERELALAVWRNRAIDARERAKRKERAAAFATVLLASILLVFGGAAAVDVFL